MPGFCWCGSPTVDDVEAKPRPRNSRSNTAQTQPDRASPSESKETRPTAVVRLENGNEGPIVPESEFASKKVPKEKINSKATLQELSSKYQRGVFDPATLGKRRIQTGDSERKVSNSTPSPKTPSQVDPQEIKIRDSRSSKGQEDAESTFTGADSECVDNMGGNIFSTLSTLSNATSSRPQPIHELQSLLGVSLTPDSSTEPIINSDQTCGQTPCDRSRSTSRSFTSVRTTQEHSLKDMPLRSVKSQKDTPPSKEASLCSIKSQKDATPSTPQSVKKAVRKSIGLRQYSLGTPIGGEQELSMASLSLDTRPLHGHPHYQILDILAGGTSGHIFVCQDRRTDEKVVVKMLGRGVANAKVAEREVANLRLCAMHPYIIHMRKVFLTEDYLAIVMDYANGGNLTSYIERHQSSKPGKGISEERCRWIFYQVAVAVEFCHRMGFANRDIKMDNVLLVPTGPAKTAIPRVKLSDFGFSKDEYADSVCKTSCGTPECVAPEVLTGGLYEGKTSDIWSLGVLFYAMLTGNYPFSRPADKELNSKAALRTLFDRIMHAKYAMPMHLSREALHLLSRMLTPEPSERITAGEILVHPYFANHKKKTMLASVNDSLLEVSDSMLTGVLGQSDEEITELIRQASRQPTVPTASQS